MGDLPKSTKRRDFIRRCRELGFTGPHKGSGDHPEYMVRDKQVVKIPNPHTKGGDIYEGLLKQILGNAGISPAEWTGTGSGDYDDAQQQQSEQEDRAQQ